MESEQLVVARGTDILTNEAGSRIMASFVFVEDVATGTVKVDMFGTHLRSCLTIRSRRRLLFSNWRRAMSATHRWLCPSGEVVSGLFR